MRESGSQRAIRTKFDLCMASSERFVMPGTYNELSPLVGGGDGGRPTRARTASAGSAGSAGATNRGRHRSGTMDSVGSGRERRNSFVFGLNDQLLDRPNIVKPRYDQSTYWGRARHFFLTTNPLNVFASEEDLDRAQCVTHNFIHCIDEEPPLSIDEIWQAKQLYDSAFHPQTGEKVMLPARMSFAVYGNMLLSGCMLTYHTRPADVMFFQFLNQSYNAMVNFYNRNTSAEVSHLQLLSAYLAASTTSVTVALYLNHYLGGEGSFLNHFVPFFAVAAANSINVPMMRQNELKNGITVELEDGTAVGPSTAAAASAVLQVIPCRLLQAVPPMVFPPIVMAAIKDWPLLLAYPCLYMLLMVLCTGSCLIVSIPLACALFPQIGEIAVDDMEPEKRAMMKSDFPEEDFVYYHKGL